MSDVSAWVIKRGGFTGLGEHQAIGFFGPNGIEAGAVYHNWDPEMGSIEISVAGDGAWITRRRVVEMFEYPFAFCRLVWGRTQSPVLRRAWRHLGGAEHDVPGLFTLVTLSADQWKEYTHGRK
jgi:hypothetical protein